MGTPALNKPATLCPIRPAPGSPLGHACDPSLSNLKKPLKTGAESRFRAKLDAHDNPTITLIIEPNPTRDNVRRTGPAAAAGHVGRDPVDASDSRSLACPETRSPSLPYTSTRSRPPLF